MHSCATIDCFLKAFRACAALLQRVPRCAQSRACGAAVVHHASRAPATSYGGHLPTISITNDRTSRSWRLQTQYFTTVSPISTPLDCSFAQTFAIHRTSVHTHRRSAASPDSIHVTPTVNTRLRTSFESRG